MAAAVHFFSRKLNQCFSETTVRSIWKAYVEDARKQKGLENEEDIQDLPRRLCDNDTRQLGLAHHILKCYSTMYTFLGV